MTLRCPECYAPWWAMNGHQSSADELQAILDRHEQDSTPSGSAAPHTTPAQPGGGTTTEE